MEMCSASASVPKTADPRPLVGLLTSDAPPELGGVTHHVTQVHVRFDAREHEFAAAAGEYDVSGVRGDAWVLTDHLGDPLAKAQKSCCHPINFGSRKRL